MIAKVIHAKEGPRCRGKDILAAIEHGAYDLVISDIDGVVGDTEPFHVAARKWAIEKYILNEGETVRLSYREMLDLCKGKNVDVGTHAVLLRLPETCEKFRPLRDIPAHISLEDERLDPVQRELLGKIKFSSKKKGERFRELLRTEPFSGNPGVVRFFSFLAEHDVRIALASSSKDALHVVRALGIEHCFTPALIYTGDRFGTVGECSKVRIDTKKDMFREVALAANVRPERIIGIEDAGHAITSFQELGMFAVGMDTEGSGEVKHADLVLKTFNDIFDRTPN